MPRMIQIRKAKYPETKNMIMERIKPMIATAPFFRDIAPKTMPMIDGKIAAKTSGA